MGILESIISVVGTLVGVLAGFLIGYYFELKRRKHEKEMEYRKEIKKHMDDIIKPLFNLLQNLWGNLGILHILLDEKQSLIKGKTLNEQLKVVQNANQALQKFVRSRYEDMSLLLPSPFPWVFAPLDELVHYRIIEPISQGKKPIGDIIIAINSLMKIQKNLRRIVGFEIDVETESVYPFKKTTHSQKSEDTPEEKLEFLVGGMKLFIAVIMGAFTAKLMEIYWVMPDFQSQIMAGLVLGVAVMIYSLLFYFVLYNIVRILKRQIKKKKA